MKITIKSNAFEFYPNVIYLFILFISIYSSLEISTVGDHRTEEAYITITIFLSYIIECTI